MDEWITIRYKERKKENKWIDNKKERERTGRYIERKEKKKWKN